MKKLVRDNIPLMMQEEGNNNFLQHIADDAEYKKALREKLQEELNEFLQDNNVEELADIVEVIHALADYEFGGFQEVEKARQKKVAERGGFYKKIIIEKTF
jgi:predicted house-cleaning noncanonical NTP pyrophosphatase (MazG superfamily)